MASVAKRKWTHKGVAKEAWVVRYFDEKGARRAKTFDLKKDAETYRRKVEREIHDGLHAPDSASVTIEILSKMFTEMRSQLVRDGQLASGSHRIDGVNIKCHILPTLGKVHLRDLTVTMVDQWLVDLRNKPGHRGLLQRQTIKMVVKTFRLMVDFAVRREIVKKNVVTEVGKWAEHRTGPLNVIRTLTDDQAVLVIDQSSRKRGEMTDRGVAFTHAVVLLAACCGLRYGEVMGMTWANLDFAGKRLHVRHSLDYKDVVRSTKTKAGRRTVPMPSVVVEALKAWKQHAPDDPRDLVFRTRSGKACTAGGFHANNWRPLLRAAGIEEVVDGKRIHFHALRHFFASRCVNGGIPLPDVAALLGHKSFDVTLMIYAHPLVNEDSRYEMVENLTSRYSTAVNSVTQQRLMAA